MDVRTRVLVTDFSLAAGATSVGALGTAGSPYWIAAIAVFGTAVLVCCLYLAEQTPLLAVVASPAATLLLGVGPGLAGYRFRYGVVGPVPDRRLAEATSGLDLNPPPGQS